MDPQQVYVMISVCNADDGVAQVQPQGWAHEVQGWSQGFHRWGVRWWREQQGQMQAQCNLASNAQQSAKDADVLAQVTRVCFWQASSDINAL